MDIQDIKDNISRQGFTILDSVFNDTSVSSISDCIETAQSTTLNFRKGGGLFAIRRFLFEVPVARDIVFTPTFISLFKQLFGDDYITVKSIYFDKPPASNWFVGYHQDLTIAVAAKADCAGFGPWTVKQEQFSVQPPVAVLENNYTIRIHLDDTLGENGALRVIPGSHRDGIWKHQPLAAETETICPVPRGGIMIMKPLLLHASRRSVNQQRRRVIHIEFSNYKLPAPLQWSEAW